MVGWKDERRKIPRGWSVGRSVDSHLAIEASVAAVRGGLPGFRSSGHLLPSVVEIPSWKNRQTTRRDSALNRPAEPTRQPSTPFPSTGFDSHHLTPHNTIVGHDSQDFPFFSAFTSHTSFSCTRASSLILILSCYFFKMSDITNANNEHNVRL